MLAGDLVVGVAMGLTSSLALNLYHRGGSMPRPSMQYKIRNVRVLPCKSLRAHVSLCTVSMVCLFVCFHSQDEVVEAGKRLVRVNLDGQVDFLAGMRVQQMQTELDEALTFGNGCHCLPIDPSASKCISRA
jgi:hypothetical protein